MGIVVQPVRSKARNNEKAVVLGRSGSGRPEAEIKTLDAFKLVK